MNRAINHVRRERRYVMSFILFVIFKMAAAITVSLTNDRHAKSGPFIAKVGKIICAGRVNQTAVKQKNEYVKMNLNLELKGCINCGIPIQLADCFQERRYGLCSLLYIDRNN